MDYLSDAVSDGVRERRFVLGDAPGVLFSPSPGGPAGPLVLLAHGGGQHAAHPAVLSRARCYAGSYGFTVVALDAPGHGGRPRSAQLAASLAALPAAMAGAAPAAAVARLNAEIAAEAVPEWRAVLDALTDNGHAPASVGFVGFSLGATISVPLLASEPRITSAVLGLVGFHGLVDDAACITVPVQLVVQWDDELVARDDALALFAAIGSSEKRLHVNPGGHAQVPSSAPALDTSSPIISATARWPPSRPAPGPPPAPPATRGGCAGASCCDRRRRRARSFSGVDPCGRGTPGRSRLRAWSGSHRDIWLPWPPLPVTPRWSCSAGMTPSCSMQPATRSGCGSPPTAKSSPHRAPPDSLGNQGPGPTSQPGSPEPTGGSPAPPPRQPSRPTSSSMRSNASAPSTTCGTSSADRAAQAAHTLYGTSGSRSAIGKPRSGGSQVCARRLITVRRRGYGHLAFQCRGCDNGTQRCQNGT